MVAYAPFWYAFHSDEVEAVAVAEFPLTCTLLNEATTCLILRSKVPFAPVAEPVPFDAVHEPAIMLKSYPVFWLSWFWFVLLSSVLEELPPPPHPPDAMPHKKQTGHFHPACCESCVVSLLLRESVACVDSGFSCVLGTA